MLSKVYDYMAPPEQRGLGQQALAAGIGYMSNFVGNLPIWNSGAYLLEGRDPMTGEKLLDNDAPWDQKLLTAVKLTAQDILPPQLPGGRDWAAFDDARHAPIAPKTGRPFKADEAVTAFVRGVTGLTFRGSTAQYIGDILRLKTRGKGPLVDDDDLIMTMTHRVMTNMPGNKETDTSQAKYGDQNALRALIYKSVDTTLPEAERKDADAKAAALASRMAVAPTIPGVEVQGMTDTQYRHLKQRLLSGTSTDFFALQPLHVQAATLTLLDAAGLPDVRQRELIHAMLYSEMSAVKLPADPGVVANALAFIDARLRDPTHNPRLDSLRKELAVRLQVAKVKDAIDTFKAPMLDQVKRAIRGGF
jgi:hypothetical protein